MKAYLKAAFEKSGLEIAEGGGYAGQDEVYYESYVLKHGELTYYQTLHEILTEVFNVPCKAE